MEKEERERGLRNEDHVGEDILIGFARSRRTIGSMVIAVIDLGYPCLFGGALCSKIGGQCEKGLLLSAPRKVWEDRRVSTPW